MSDGLARDELRSLIRRIENLEKEIKALNDDKSGVYKEAKGRGFDVKVMRKCVSARRLDANERQETDALYDFYMSVLDGSAETGTEVAIARAPAHATPDHDPITGEILESGAATNGSFSSSDPHEADESGSPIQESPSNRDVSADGEAWTPGAPQGYPDQPQAKAEVEASNDEPSELAGHEGRSEGEATSVGLPTNSNPQASSSRQADKAEAPNSSPDASAVNPKRGHPLRPLCRYPGDDRCGGYGYVTCHACLTAAQEGEAA